MLRPNQVTDPDWHALVKVASGTQHRVRSYKRKELKLQQAEGAAAGSTFLEPFDVIIGCGGQHRS